MRKFALFVVLILAAAAAACNQTPAPRPRTAFQESAENLSLTLDLTAKKQLLANNQEKHLAEMARQEAELQLRAQRASELSQAVERLAAEQKALGEEIRRRTPPPPPSRSAMAAPYAEEGEAPQMQLAEERQAPAPTPQPVVQQYYLSNIVSNALAAEERQRQQASHRGGGWRVARNTAGWAAVGGGTGAIIGAATGGRSGAIGGTWKGAAAGVATGFFIELLRR